MSQRPEIKAELETLRLFILRYRDAGGPVLLDGDPASASEIADLKLAIARFERLSLELGGNGVAPD